MAFDSIRDSQPTVVRLLEQSVARDRLSHAYLFEGEVGTKKFETAIYFAQMLLCKAEDHRPCQQCSNCRRIRQGIHPNVMQIEPVKDTIRKNQIQDLQEEFSKTAIEPGKKIYVIRDIDKISPGAANSILKFLEEPYPDIHAILTTSNINRILPTIISRSQIVSFASLPKRVIEAELRDAGYETDHARLLSQLTNNAEDAMSIAGQEWFLDVLDAVLDIYRMLAREEEGLLIHFNRQYDILYQDKETTHFLLSCMILYHKDILHVLEDDLPRVVFQSELDQLSRLALQHPKQRRIDELERMLSLQGRLRSYINERLAFDNLLLELERR